MDRHSTDSPAKPGSTVDDVAEIARLRARVAEPETAQAAAASRTTSPQRGARAFLSAALIVIACVLAPLSAMSAWASTVVSQTDRYVETIAPLAGDPGVQAAIADEVTAAIMGNLDVEEVTNQALQALAQQENMPPRVAAALPALAVPLTRGIEDFTRAQSANFTQSAEFKTVWAEVNRIAHAQVVRLLTGNAGGAISAQDNQVLMSWPEPTAGVVVTVTVVAIVVLVVIALLGRPSARGGAEERGDEATARDEASSPGSV